MTSVPFTKGVYGGFAKCHGLIRPAGDSLLLEYQVQDNMLGIVRGRARSVRIPLADLESVELKGRWFGRSLVLKARSLMTLSQVPGAEQGRLELIVSRADWPAAEQLVSGVYE